MWPFETKQILKHNVLPLANRPQAPAMAFIGGKLLWRNSIGRQDEGTDD